ncbi:MAG: CAP domain-containing protein [Anaerolineales bacterium]|nr:CAP domain-containing protein [Anaerolineales bacterium]
MNKALFYLFAALTIFAASAVPKENVEAQPQSGITSAAQLIAAVNNLRAANGLAPLSEHPALMQSAQMQADYMAAGVVSGHERPNGTYTQQLLALGFPLAGDLSLGGMRSENILNTSGELSWDGVPSAWQDAQHMNTMLSGNYTHIGAGVSQSGGRYYYVVDTAAATGSGQPQESAVEMLTRVPNSADAGVSQFMVPVTLSTPRPDGRVFHKVEYGQSLWSIAVAYGTTIKKIQELNNLGEESTVYQGQELLVLLEAPPSAAPTLSAPTAIPPTMTFVLTTTRLPTFAPKTATVAPTETPASTASSKPISSRLLTVVLIAAALIGAGMAVWLIRDPQS